MPCRREPDPRQGWWHIVSAYNSTPHCADSWSGRKGQAIGFVDCDSAKLQNQFKIIKIL